MSNRSHEVVVVGAGAAGLMTAIAAGRTQPGIDLVLLDGANRPGAKILISGGGRCNVTNIEVSARDFHGDRALIDRVLRRFDRDATVALFAELGVPLKVEAAMGKFFPRSDRARDVLEALLGECARLGLPVVAGERVVAVERCGQRLELTTSRGRVTTSRLVLATGGCSVPGTGSDGGGYELARALGHSVTPTHPALVALLLDPHPLAELAGVTFSGALQAWANGRCIATATGSVLSTHRGLSGPCALDISRWVTIVKGVEIRLSFLPGRSATAVERQLIEQGRQQPAATLRSSFERLPHRLTDSLAVLCGLDSTSRVSGLSRLARRTVAQAMTSLVLPVVGTRGFAAAEATAGGVPLTEVNVSTMESRVCAGLYLVGEILDVDGRIGGFNFQWAWSSGSVAGRAVARR